MVLNWSRDLYVVTLPGADRSRIFGGGGGGAQKIMCAHAHHEREAQSPA